MTTYTIQRPLKGSRVSSFYPVKTVPPLSSIDSAFQLQEYISLLIRADVHDVERIVSIPGGEPGKRREGSDSSTGSDDSDRDSKGEVPVDEACWIYEHLRRLAQDLSHPLITMLQQECTRQTCPEMKAGEWLYLCVAHGNDGATEQCCAIDYIVHTLDSATALLNSPRAFSSRLQIPVASHRHFPSLARRLGRIFAHAYFHHREAFEQAEAESSLYARFLAFTSKFGLVPSEFLVIPPRLSSMSDENRSLGRPTNLLESHSYLKPDSGDQRRAWDFGSSDSESVVDLNLSDDERQQSNSRGVSPLRKSRNRTGTMVHSEAAHAVEELSRADTGTLREKPQSEVDRVLKLDFAKRDDPVDAVLPPTEVPPREPSPPAPEEKPAQLESSAEPATEAHEPPVQEEEKVMTEPKATIETLDIVAPPPSEPSIPPQPDETDEDITEASLDDVPVSDIQGTDEEDTSAMEKEQVSETVAEESPDVLSTQTERGSPPPDPAQVEPEPELIQLDEPIESQSDTAASSTLEAKEEAEVVENVKEPETEPAPKPETEPASLVQEEPAKIETAPEISKERGGDESKAEDS